MLSLTYNFSLFIHVLGDMRIFFQLHFDVVVVLVGFFFACSAGFVGVLRVVLPPKKNRMDILSSTKSIIETIQLDRE